uniref:Uncharacterized protein n=1 Tax=Anguilla anguilla TaxID=7936 RepID=A0A0E9Y0C2_ANGAN
MENYRIKTNICLRESWGNIPQ